ncbi:MAG: glutaredoxin family protein [Sedimenticola sp.]|uniref:Glutaredoxin family protein n=1 Tax=Sedimenticola thiotaurini TaxID=1543721 RepID=A0A558CT55_9GAMM|nr:glutaredoxin family protein [Sedimenticola sp.]TVT51961.1 MAG: glutaredoxin family protein [Sedimenticola thiotaurini]MCW8921831.1 glutaredoxin family protein [Sedimenticola sp.]MCW8946693.1 glutaredoxin family protein [Sedimenticola sp.]MCW8949337.1 glutaredoxin family protein [Sedimenticola sp.]
MVSRALIFYYRDGCHLCEDMWHQLREMQEQRPFEVQLQNIDSDPELKLLYGSLIPVLAVGKQVICNYYLDPIAVEKHLDGLALNA